MTRAVAWPVTGTEVVTLAVTVSDDHGMIAAVVQVVVQRPLPMAAVRVRCCHIRGRRAPGPAA